MQPEVRYARSGDVSVAFQDFGSGPPLVIVPGFISHLDMAWELPSIARALERISSFARVISFDKRGTGLSDPVSVAPTLEERMDDVRAVMDATGVERATLLGISEGGPMCLLFAATYPERTAGLVLYGTCARFLVDEDYPWGFSKEQLQASLDFVASAWGTGVGLNAWAPSVGEDPVMRSWWARFQRAAASPAQTMEIMRLPQEIDVRAVLPTIRVPTVVLHRVDDRIVKVGAGRHLVEHIPGARFVEMPGADHFWWTQDHEMLLGELEEFLTGARSAVEADRILATILFTDLVDSTSQGAALGDRRWHQMLEAHHDAARREIDRFRGRAIKTMGDGMLATFDGPARAIRCALAIRGTAEAAGLSIRAGLHTGECEVMGDDIAGIAVNTAARVSAAAGPGEVLVSSTVRDLVAGSELRFADRGTHDLKGIPGEWRLLLVEG